ncbi:MAG: hypothetical protein KDD44_02055, partial [Bdellovibrionales bacterium]|nr:hypothetical protein [Bdellovibrionales bacterium]
FERRIVRLGDGGIIHSPHGWMAAYHGRRLPVSAAVLRAYHSSDKERRTIIGLLHHDGHWAVEPVRSISGGHSLGTSDPATIGAGADGPEWVFVSGPAPGNRMELELLDSHRTICVAFSAEEDAHIEASVTTRNGE